MLVLKPRPSSQETDPLPLCHPLTCNLHDKVDRSCLCDQMNFNVALPTLLYPMHGWLPTACPSRDKYLTNMITSRGHPFLRSFTSRPTWGHLRYLGFNAHQFPLYGGGPSFGIFGNRTREPLIPSPYPAGFGLVSSIFFYGLILCLMGPGENCLGPELNFKKKVK